MKPSEAALDFWPAGEPKRGTFDITLRGGGREQRTGYVLKDFAVHRPAKGEYFWTLTHIPTGLSVNIYPPMRNKLEALQMLSNAAGGFLRKDLREQIDKYAARGWGGGQ